MKRSARAVALALSAVLALAACSAKPDNEVTGSSTGTVAAQASGSSAASGGGAPAAGSGETITAVENTAGGAGVEQIASPWFNSGSLSQSVMFRALFRAEPNLTDVKPDLAEKYTEGADHKSLTITLKKGLKWSDGQPLTADDVVWSLNSILRVAKANAIYVTAFKQIEGADTVKAGSDATMSGVTAKGDEITIKLKNPVSNIVPVLAQFMILPKHSLAKSDPLKMDTDAFWKNPVTSGPFKVGQLSQGNFITLVPNENYEGPKPKITKINVVASADPVSDASAGKIDYFTTNDAEIIKSMKDVSSFAAHPIDILFYRYFAFNLTQPNAPFADVKAREALKYAVDWNSLVTSLYPELGVVINSGVPDGYPAHDKSIAKYTFDPAKAKQLLQEAKFDFGKTIRLRYYYSDQTSINLMTAVAQQLMDVGMKVEVLKFQGDPTTELYTTKKWDVAFKGLSSFGFNEWYGEYTNTPTFTQIIGEQPEFATLNQELNEATSQDKTDSVLMQLQKLEQQKLLKLPLYSLKQYVFVSKRIKNADKFGNPLYIYDNNFANWTVG
jgi:peptide/nickel transport system substrate-binding protein